MSYTRTKPTDWDKYQHNRPTNSLVRWFFLDVVFNAYKELLKHAVLPGQPTILELGSGTGYITKKLALFLKSKTVALVDSNQNMVEISKETFKKVPVKVKFIKSDFFALNIKRKFHIVHSTGVVEHFDPEEQYKLVKLHADLLLPGGYCIIFVPTPTLSYKILRRLAEIAHLWKYTDEVPMTELELKDVVQKAGLKILAVNYFWKNCWLSEVGVIAQKKKN